MDIIRRVDAAEAISADFRDAGMRFHMLEPLGLLFLEDCPSYKNPG